MGGRAGGENAVQEEKNKGEAGWKHDKNMKICFFFRAGEGKRNDTNTDLLFFGGGSKVFNFRVYGRGGRGEKTTNIQKTKGWTQ